MCRHLAYLGPPRPLAALVLEPDYGLLRQSYAPRDMRGGGTVNADGFGVGWYPSGSGRPARQRPARQRPARHRPARHRPIRYRSDRPLWADPSFAELAAVTQAGAVLAAVRSATVGMPVVATACAPFTDGRRLFSHNGVVAGWPDTVGPLAAALPVTDLLTLDAPTDAALLWALVRHRLRAGAGPAAALAGVVTEVAAVAPDSKLNLLLTNGTEVYATAWRHSLAVRVESDAVTVASEPHDELPGWTPIPDGHLVVAGPGQARTEPVARATDSTGTPTAPPIAVVADRKGD